MIAVMLMIVVDADVDKDGDDDYNFQYLLIGLYCGTFSTQLYQIILRRALGG